MANTNKTKADILQELESIKGLLLEEDDIPILQDADIIEEPDSSLASSPRHHESVLPGQGSLFEEANPGVIARNVFANNQMGQPAEHNSLPKAAIRNAEPEVRQGIGFTSHVASQPAHNPRQVKAAGENPFLPQHIRERLHGNNPPPLFEYEAVKNISIATRSISSKFRKPRAQLVDEVITNLMPQIESELRHRLFAMNVEDLEKILNDEE
jgi:hypothetical protein